MLDPENRYQILTLEHVREQGTDIDSWNRTLDQSEAKEAARRVVIQSIPFHKDRYSNTTIDDGFETEWEERGGFHTAFQRAVARVSELPHLSAVHIRFSPNCCGIASEKNFVAYEESETRTQRMETLRTVFSALEQRAGFPRNSAVRSLTIENLQNIPVPELVYSDSFKIAVSGVEELHLSMCTEYNKYGPDADIFKEERCTSVSQMPSWVV